MKEETQLYKICKKTALAKGIWNKKYQDRLEYELSIIEEKGFEDYFLILRDIVQWSTQKNILVGPGRGSSAGSLVAYLMEITKIDPLKYDLFFERFLNPARPDLPDIDVDFQATRRDEVFDHIRSKYGEDCTCLIGTYSKFHVKQIIRDLCRIFDIPIEVPNKLTKLIPPKVETLDEAMEISEINAFFTDHPLLKELAQDLDGSIRQRSFHAAGMVITPTPVWNYMAVERVKQKLCSCFDMGGIDFLGLLKVDILSLRTLDVIAKALELAGLNVKDLPEEFDDPEVYKIFSEGRTLGVFQFKTALLTGLAKKLQISDFKTLYATTTIARPGPLHSGEADKYVKRHNKEQLTTYLHPLMQDVTEETYGLMLFQEQTMKLSVKMASFSKEESEFLRKVIGKSKGIAAIDEYKEKFLAGCIEKSVDKDIANRVWDIIRESGAYSFNKSHAVSYSAVSYWCAWLKTYYFKEFMTALMIYEEDDIQMNAAIELREKGFEVLPPDINKSGKHVKIAEDGKIYMGLRDIEGCGEKAVEDIFLHRPYENFDEFLSKVTRRKVNAKVIKNLIQAGAFDAFDRRDTLYYGISGTEIEIWDEKEKVKRQSMVLDMPSTKPLIDFYENQYEPYLDITPIKEIDFNDVHGEVWVRGIISELNVRDRLNPPILPGTQQMASFVINDGTKKIPVFVAPETYVIFKECISEAAPVLVKAHTYGSNEKLYADGIINLEDTETNVPTFLKYVDRKRKGDLLKVKDADMVSVVKNVSYHISRGGGRAYAKIYFDGDGLGLWFDVTKTPICPGEIFVWKTSGKEPYIKVLRRIP